MPQLGHHSSAWPSAAVAAFLFWAAPGEAQTDRVRLATVLDSAGSLVAGVSAGSVIGTGPAFSGVSAGVGLQLFVGVPFAAVDEVRLGGGWSIHGDQAMADPVTLTSAYLETHVAIVRTRLLVLRVAPRLAWIELDRAIWPTKLHDFGFGGVVGARTHTQGRFSFESAIGLTGVTFNTPISAIQDPDLTESGWIWEFRLGAAFRLR
jgi:hypothetical protein